MADLEKELIFIKQELEKNISDIEETSDSLSANVEELYTKILKHIESVRNEYLNQLAMKTKACKMELKENAESIGDKIVYIKQCTRSLNDLKEETKDVQYVREFHETSKKYTMLKDLYSKDKFRLKLLGLTSIPDAHDIERTKLFSDVNVVTIKTIFSEETIPGCSLALDSSLKTKERKKKRCKYKYKKMQLSKCMILESDESDT